MADVQTQQSAFRRALANAKADAKASRREKETGRMHVAELEAAMLEMSTERRAAHARLKVAQSRSAYVTSKFNGAREALLSLRLEKKNLVSKLETAESEKVTIKIKLKKANSQISKLEGKVNMLGMEIKSLHKETQVLPTTQSRLKKVNDSTAKVSTNQSSPENDNAHVDEIGDMMHCNNSIEQSLGENLGGLLKSNSQNCAVRNHPTDSYETSPPTSRQVMLLI